MHIRENVDYSRAFMYQKESITKQRAIAIIKEYVAEHLDKPTSSFRQEDMEARCYKRHALLEMARYIQSSDEDTLSTAFRFVERMEDYMHKCHKDKLIIFASSYTVCRDVYEIIDEI